MEGKRTCQGVDKNRNECFKLVKPKPPERMVKMRQATVIKIKNVKYIAGLDEAVRSLGLVLVADETHQKTFFITEDGRWPVLRPEFHEALRRIEGVTKVETTKVIIAIAH
ncbi:MAG: hypothetical protein Q8N16_02760 [bacterium]|nr:hypothetical protein [bacterium]